MASSGTARRRRSAMSTCRHASGSACGTSSTAASVASASLRRRAASGDGAATRAGLAAPNSVSVRGTMASSVGGGGPRAAEVVVLWLEVGDAASGGAARRPAMSVSASVRATRSLVA